MPLSKRQAWALGAAVVIFGFWQWHRIGPPPPEIVGKMEANHPWLVFDPTEEQGLPGPFADKNDSNILYLIFSMRNGSAVKINLKEKIISPFFFKNDSGDPASTSRCLLVHTRASGGWISHSIPGKEGPSEKVPIWDEFRGHTEMRRVSHLFGYPFANKPGERTATLQTGYWYVMDGREGEKVELLRVKVQNSEVGGGDGLGDLYLSPNRRWAVFRVANRNPHRIYIFDREAKTPEVFQ
jgi:hypothetical protein